MAAEGFNSRINIANMSFKYFVLLLLPELISCYTYPFFGGKRPVRPVSIHRSAYLPLSVSRHHEYQLPDYDDGFMQPSQDEYEYNAYDKYPFVQYFGYYPSRDYYHDKTPRRNMNNFGYFDDQIPQDSMEDLQDETIPSEKDNAYSYGQETWYEGEPPRYDSNAEANAAFVHNLIMAQMYQDAKSQHYPSAYDSTVDDYDDRHWLYGVPTTEVDEKERVQQFFRDREDEEVRELESLTRMKEKNKKIKDKNSFKKQADIKIIDKPTKPKSKMTDDEYFDMQKQIIVNSRKNNHAPFAGNLRVNKKQIYNPDVKDNLWDFYQPRMNKYPEPKANSKQKLNLNKDGKNTKDLMFSDRKVKVESSMATVSSTASPKKPIAVGQKEVVLPRPSNPVRRPFAEISSRSLQHQPSVYDTIKQLLNMEEDLQKDKKPQPQKRFVLNEDQLTAELTGLKKLSA